MLKATALLSLSILAADPAVATTTTTATTSNTSSSMLKTVKKVLPRPRAHWVGDGFNVYPVFANNAFSEAISPFLMFDYGAPKAFPPTRKQLGVGQHPHRGFETITVAFQGEVEHADSVGNRGVIGPGDVQWMTAGRGIVHEEFHSKRMAKEGGTLEMCQLWLNLPAKDKMVAPRYQPILDAEIPVSPLYAAGGSQGAAGAGGGDGAAAGGGGGGTCAARELSEGGVRVIAGSFQGVAGAARTHSQVDLWDVAIAHADGVACEFDTVEGNNVVIFVRRGRVEVQGKKLGPQDVAILNLAGSKVLMTALEADSRVLVMAGEPLGEPIAAQGPFVMNTQTELRQAMMDYQSGNFGT